MYGRAEESIKKAVPFASLEVMELDLSSFGYATTFCIAQSFATSVDKLPEALLSLPV